MLIGLNQAPNIHETKTLFTLTFYWVIGNKLTISYHRKPPSSQFLFTQNFWLAVKKSLARKMSG